MTTVHPLPSLAIFSLVVAASAPATTYAQAPSFQAEGTAAIAAGSIDPPNPVEGCNKAKQDAKKKAASAGYTGDVKWDHLSTDSDCSLKTPGARGVGYFFIFTAKGTFSK